MTPPMSPAFADDGDEGLAVERESEGAAYLDIVERRHSWLGSSVVLTLTGRISQTAFGACS